MRKAEFHRVTKETDVFASINLDGTGKTDIDTGIGFLNHMLTLFAFHGGFDLVVKAKGDLDVDDHHTIEDIGIVLGIIVKEALGSKAGIARYGSFSCVMDEALARVDLDCSGRPFIVFHGDFNRETVGAMSTEMVPEFLRAFAFNSLITLHVNILYGENDHHKIEAVFKALGHALNAAVTTTGGGVFSTKGSLA